MLDSYRDLIDGLIEEPKTLRALLGDPVADDVSPEVVALLKEMRGRETAVLRRSTSVMRKENVNLRSIESEPEVASAAESQETPEELMEAFQHDRGELVTLLMNLTLKDWERRVSHYVLGETTLSDEIEDHLTWEEDILGRLRAALAAG